MDKSDPQKRLPEYPEPLELTSHEEAVAAEAASSDTAAKTAAETTAETADVDEVSGGTIAWAGITGVAVALIVGAIAWMAGVFTPQTEVISTPVAYQITAIGIESPDATRATADVLTDNASDFTASPTGHSSDPDAVCYFSTNGSDVSADDSQLETVAKQAIASDADIEVEGYTDPSGSTAYNQKLSQRRAQAVANRLIALGVDPAHIHAAGFGPTDIYANAASDRRVNVYLN